MAVFFSQQALVASPGAQYRLSSLLSMTTVDQPEYVVLTGLDRERYTAASNGDRGTLGGNGSSLAFAASGSDCYNFGVVFSATDKGYYNSTFGYLSDLTFKSSTDNNRSECLSLYGFGTAGAPNDALYAKLAKAIADPTFAGLAFTYASTGGTDSLAYSTSNYCGTLDIVTRSGYTDATPNQATPKEIAAVAATFVGQAWNKDGCWNLACEIAASAGASLPLTSTKALPAQTPPVANGEWIVAYDSATVSADQQKNWISLLRAGDVVVANNTCGGHVATVVAGSGYASLIVDNYGSASGDGSPDDVTIRPAHDLLNLIIPADSKNIVIYRLDAPQVSVNKSICLPLHGTTPVAPLFSAGDPAGKPIVGYQLYDTNDGSFIVDGATLSAHTAATAITVDQSALSNVVMATGPTTGKDTIQVRAYNGSYWGDWQGISVDIGSTIQPAVVRTLASEVQLHGGKSVALSALIDVTAPASAVSSYTITDPGTSGRVSLNGAIPLASNQAASTGTTYEISAADFSKLTFVAGANIGGETLTITARNGAALPSNTAEISMATIAPTVVGISHYVESGKEIPLSALFAVTQLDNAPLVSYSIDTAVKVLSWGANTPSSGGTIHLNGAAVLLAPYPGYYQIAAADLDKVTFQAAPDTGAQLLNFAASDGAFGVSGTTMITTVSGAAPVKALAASVTSGTTIAAASLFILDQGQAVPTYYRFLDPTGGGSLQLDPSGTNLQSKSDASPGVFVIAGTDIGKLAYLGGTANGTESIAVSTSSDNFHWTAEVSLPVSTTGVITGGIGNDVFSGAANNSVFDGNGGVDSIVYAGNSSAYALMRNGSGEYLIQGNSGTGGTDCLRNIDRVQFADKKIALDVAATGSAGKTVELIGAALGKAALTAHKDYVGIGLQLFDGGYSMDRAAQVCIDAGLVSAPDNTSFVKAVWLNVVGSPIDAANLNYFTGLLQGSGGTMSQAALLQLAATSQTNQDHVGLIGLASTGIEYA